MQQSKAIVGYAINDSRCTVLSRGANLRADTMHAVMAVVHEHNHDREAVCPRCGYDQRGVIAMWNDKGACPLEGVCTECGLEWRWGEIFNPRLDPPRWCVEYALHWWAIPPRFVTTVAMVCLPWRFWRSLKLTHPPQWRRLTGFVAAMVIVYALAIGAAQASRAWLWWRQEFTGGYSQTIERPYYMLYCAALPLSRTHPGTFMRRGWSVPSPMPQPLRFFIDDWRYELGQWRHMLWLHVLCAMSFVLLPFSLRRAKVRWVHVARIAIYGLPWILAPVVWRFPAIFLDVEASAWSARNLVQWSDLCSRVGMWWLKSVPLFEFLWWSLATSRYLRLPHAWGIGAVVTIIAWLVVFLLEVLDRIWPLL